MNNPNTPSSATASPLLSELKSIEALIQQMQLPQAAQALNRLQKLHPLDPRVYLLGSWLAECSGNQAAMLASAVRASELAPRWHVATLRLAQALRLADKGEAAVQQAGKAIEEAKSTSAQERQQILQSSVDVAIPVGAYAKASQWLEELMALSPQAVAPRVQQAQILAHTGQWEAAYERFGQALQLAPDSTPARIGHMLCAQHLGQPEQAEADARHLAEHAASDPVAQFHAAVVLGRKPATQPAELIGQLFDNYAPLFDQHLVRGLGYTLPRDVARLIESWHPDRRLNLLDLGCGTGLLGVCLGRVEGAIIGVDLSSGMISRASRHGVYDRFHQVNLLDALADTPDGLYQVIAALDVLNYVGDLSSVLPNALRILAPGGRFVFSCEALTSGRSNYTLDPRTLRYQHARRHIEKLCEKAGFAATEWQEIDLRQEQGQSSPGFLIIATKPAAAAHAPVEVAESAADATK